MGSPLAEAGLPPAGGTVSSSQVNVFVTGGPGVGKTWLVRNVLRSLGGVKCAGFYTEDVRDPSSGDKVGLDVVSLSGQRAVLSRLKRSNGPKVGKYYISLEAFEELVLPGLEPREGVQLHVIDEVNRMALCSERFRAALMKLLDSPDAVVFGSLPAPRYGHTLELVEGIKQRNDTAVLTLSKANCATTSRQVGDLLLKLLGVPGGGGEAAAAGDDSEPAPQGAPVAHGEAPPALPPEMMQASMQLPPMPQQFVSQMPIGGSLGAPSSLGVADTQLLVPPGYVAVRMPMPSNVVLVPSEAYGHALGEPVELGSAQPHFVQFAAMAPAQAAGREDDGLQAIKRQRL